jgi:rubrerythrin
MSRQFDVRELVRVAVIDERSGKELYGKMEKKAKDGDLKRTFADLVKQEERHEKRFETLLGDLESRGEQTTSQYPDEYVDYLEMVTAGGGRSEAQSKLDDAEGDIDLIDLAVLFEQEQLLLQQDMAKILGDKHRAVADEIIREEQAHLVSLSKSRDKLAL